MFVYHSKDSTAVVNYVPRYYNDSVYSNQNALITTGLTRQQWEENGFVLVRDVPYTLGASPHLERNPLPERTGCRDTRRLQWLGGKSPRYSDSSSFRNNRKRDGRRIPMDGIIDHRINVGFTHQAPSFRDPKLRTLSAISDAVNSHGARDTVFGESVDEKCDLCDEAQAPSYHTYPNDLGFDTADGDMGPTAYDVVDDYEGGDLTLHDIHIHTSTMTSGITNSAYYSKGDEDIKTSNDVQEQAEGDNAKDESERLLNSGFWFWYSKFIVRFPVLFCVAIILLTVAAGAVAFTLYDIPQFDDPEKGFEARHTPIRDRLTGLELFNRITDDDNFHIMNIHDIHTVSRRSVLGNFTLPTLPTDVPTSTRVDMIDRFDDSLTTRSPSSEENATNQDQFKSCVEPGLHWHNLRIVFSVVNPRTSLFSVDAFHSMCRLFHEHVLPGVTEPPTNCQPASLGIYAALLRNKASCYDTTEDDVTHLVDLLTECAPHYANGSLQYGCSPTSCPTVPRYCIDRHAVYNIFHYLLPSESASRFERGDLDVSFSLMITPISGFGSTTGQLYTDRLQGRKDLRDDFMKITAIGGQFKFMLFSSFLISDIKLVGLAVAVAVFIIWLYTRSLFITLLTIADMAMALVWAYFIYVVVIGLPFFPFVNILAVILVLGIGADDTFVYMDLWRKCGEKYSNREENMVKILQETLHHAAITMFVTSFTTSSALFFSIISSITAIKCFAVYSGCAILFNFLFTLTWLPAIVIIEERYLRCRKCRNRHSLKCSSLKVVTQALETASIHVFEKALPKIVFKLRYVWLIIFTLLGIGGGCAIFIYPKLQLPTQSVFQIFIKSDFLEQYDQVYVDHFDFEQLEQSKMPMKFVWGLESKDNGNAWDPDDRGSLVLDNLFNISSPESQEWLLNFCSDVKNQSFYSPQDSNQDFCFIDIFREIMMESPCNNPLFHQDVSPCCENFDFPYEPELFEQCASKFVALAGLEPMTRFGEGQKLTGLLLSFTSNTRYSLNYESIDTFWNEINQWSRTEMDKAPESITHGWFVSFSENQLYFFDLQQSLVTGFPFSIGMSLGVAALVLLLTTWNVLITLFAILSISGTVFVTVGSLVFIGWELNILEATIMSLAVGLSVDFTIHYGVAYRIAPTGDRVAKSFHAMKQLTAAISTAALSTIVAGACMLPATVLSYQQIGVFLALIMGVSWTYGTFFFMSLCMVLGPEKNCCGVQPQGTSCFCCRKTEPNNNTVEKRRYASDFHNMYTY
nr:protein dispatched homolog 1-like [Lytechinus pictus]